MRTRLPHHWRFGAVVLAAVWLLVPLLALLHGSHAHRFCAEHGTFEEADSTPGDEPGLSAHEECPLLGLWARQGLTVPDQIWVTGVPSEAVCRSVSQPRVPPQLEPLLIAPKGSPPRA
ncbi:hypothetical protein [Corallococcus sp. M7]